MASKKQLDIKISNCDDINQRDLDQGQFNCSVLQILQRSGRMLITSNGEEITN